MSLHRIDAIMTQQKGKEKDKNATQKRTAKDPMKMVEEASKLKNTAPASFPPGAIDLVVDQIATNQAQTARNMARLQLEESQADLDRVRTPATQPQQPTTGGMFGQGQHPMIAMMDQLPKEDRLKFIEDHKDSIFGSIGQATGGGTSPQLAKLLHADEDNGKKQSPASDMAAMMVAFSEMQQNNMQMWMNLQQFKQPETPNNGNSNTEKLMTMIFNQQKAMQETMDGQKSETQAQLHKLQQENLQMQQDRVADQIAAIGNQHAEEIQQLRKMVETRPDTVTRTDIVGMIDQIQKATGVQFSAESTADAQIRNEHQLAIKKLEIEETRAERAHAENVAASQAKQQQMKAITSIITPLADKMLFKKTMDNGGTPSAKVIANRISD